MPRQERKAAPPVMGRVAWPMSPRCILSLSNNNKPPFKGGNNRKEPVFKHWLSRAIKAMQGNNDEKLKTG
ncbi:hypothetical protein TUM17387_25230 [Shewanella carassii]|nr:hypothetical protein TUM17377_24770 [Shewanella chilikensis]BCV67164.1 hypothetical protein TUM17387_25230 [Shewanella carassii]